MQGLLLIDKLADWTSFDVVNYVRRIVANAEGKKPKNCKVGHTGTLDPFATGLLVLLVGKEYTRQAQGLSKVDKTYEVTMQLGASSTTGDPEGEITTVSDAPQPTEPEIAEALKQFVGQIEQIPPAYSAIKVNGQRAYKLARAGETVALEARQTTIHSLELIKYDYPFVSYSADVSSGTYLRTLSEDIAKVLGTSAYTTILRRTRVGVFEIQNAVDAKTLTADNLAGYLIATA